MGTEESNRKSPSAKGAPGGLRFAIPLIAQGAGMTPTAMRRAICQALLVRPDPSNWSDYPNV